MSILGKIMEFFGRKPAVEEQVSVATSDVYVTNLVDTYVAPAKPVEIVDTSASVKKPRAKKIAPKKAAKKGGKPKLTVLK